MKEQVNYYEVKTREGSKHIALTDSEYSNLMKTLAKRIRDEVELLFDMCADGEDRKEFEWYMDKSPSLKNMYLTDLCDISVSGVTFEFKSLYKVLYYPIADPYKSTYEECNKAALTKYSDVLSMTDDELLNEVGLKISLIPEIISLEVPKSEGIRRNAVFEFRIRSIVKGPSYYDEKESSELLVVEDTDINEYKGMDREVIDEIVKLATDELLPTLANIVSKPGCITGEDLEPLSVVYRKAIGKNQFTLDLMDLFRVYGEFTEIPMVVNYTDISNYGATDLVPLEVVIKLIKNVKYAIGNRFQNIVDVFYRERISVIGD